MEIKKRILAFSAVGVFVTVLMIFLVTVTNSHLRLDDWGYTQGCKFVKDGLSISNIVAAFLEPANGAIWMPLTYISYMTDITLLGEDWISHHITNVLIHAFNTILVFLLSLKLSSEKRSFTKVTCCIFVSLLWACHPMRAESVAWIAARKEELWCCFSVLGLITWIDYIKSGGYRYYIISYLFFIMACMSKPTAICFPFIAYCIHWFLRGKLSLLNYLPMILFSFIIGLLTIFSQSNPTGFEHINIYDTSLGWRILNALVAIGMYIYHTLLPMNVGFDYRAIFEGCPLDCWLGISTLLLFTSLIIFIGYKCKAITRLFIFAAGWWLLSLIPTCGVFGIVGDHAYADRYTYFPSIALAIVIAILLQNSFGVMTTMKKHITVLACSVVLLGEIIILIPVAKSYANDVTVFTRTLERDSNHWRALSILGCEYCARLGKMNEGVTMLRRSIRLSPRPSTAASLAYVLAIRGDKGDFEEVRRLGQKVIMRPRLDQTGMMLDALGIMAMREGDDNAAIKCFSLAIKAPHRGHSFENTYLNLGLCLANVGKYRDATHILSRLVKTNDKSISARAKETIAQIKANKITRFEWK